MFTVHTQNFITYTAVLTIQTTMGLIYTKCICIFCAESSVYQHCHYCGLEDTKYLNALEKNHYEAKSSMGT